MAISETLFNTYDKDFLQVLATWNGMTGQRKAGGLLFHRLLGKIQ